MPTWVLIVLAGLVILAFIYFFSDRFSRRERLARALGQMKIQSIGDCGEGDLVKVSGKIHGFTDARLKSPLSRVKSLYYHLKVTAIVVRGKHESHEADWIRDQAGQDLYVVDGDALALIHVGKYRSPAADGIYKDLVVYGDHGVQQMKTDRLRFEPVVELFDWQSRTSDRWTDEDYDRYVRQINANRLLTQGTTSYHEAYVEDGEEVVVCGRAVTPEEVPLAVKALGAQTVIAIEPAPDRGLETVLITNNMKYS